MKEDLRHHFDGTKIVSYNTSDAVQPRMRYDPVEQTVTLKAKFTALLDEEEED
jgi:hypothetical protein